MTATEQEAYDAMFNEKERLLKKVEALETKCKTLMSLTEHQWLLKVAIRLGEFGCKSDGILEAIDEVIAKYRKLELELKAEKLNSARSEMVQYGGDRAPAEIQATTEAHRRMLAEASNHTALRLCRALECIIVNLLTEYEDRRSQFGHNSLWAKHEDSEAILVARAIVEGETRNRKRFHMVSLVERVDTYPPGHVGYISSIECPPGHTVVRMDASGPITVKNQSLIFHPNDIRKVPFAEDRLRFLQSIATVEGEGGIP